MIICVVMMLHAVSPVLAAAEAPAGGETEKKLESVRTQIKDVESNIQSARDRTDAFLDELRKAEVALAAGQSKLHEIDVAIRRKNTSLKKLRSEQAAQRNRLSRERAGLRAQILAAYKVGREDFVKLLLNQEDPSSLGRMLAYHDYYNRARSRRIETVESALVRLDSLHKAIRDETGKLVALKSEQLAKLEELKGYRASRQSTIEQLRTYISSQDRHLAMLQRNEQELEALLERLRSEKSAVREYEELPPFDSLKGKLDWPVKGRIVNHYGSLRKGGRLRSHGVTISAQTGSAVRAVSAGKVIFADWFRNMGLLIILDHGNGYMSLYGHNSRLLKKPGDMVRTGNVIALVGNTGGQRHADLYFEIRKTGAPMNPDLWCHR